VNRDTPYGHPADDSAIAPPDPICTLYDEWLDVRDQIRSEPDEDQATDLSNILDRVETRLCHSMATSTAGMLCQLHWLREVLPYGLENDQRELILLTQIEAALKLL
jgi:hypothetical protein